MSSPDQERLDAISEALARLLTRQDEIEERLRRLESRQPPPVPKAVPPPLPVARPVHIGPPPIAAPPLPATHSPAQLETKVGLNWINRIGVVTLLFAAAFGFDYAAQNNWIGPGMRIALGLAAAVCAAFAGDVMRRRGHVIFAQGLTGLGIALSYLTLYASFTLYHVFPQNLAFILMVLTTSAAAALALRYQSQAIALLGLIGGYLTPILVSTGEDRPWILFTYTFLVNLGALAIARKRNWRALEYTAAIGTALLYAGWFSSRFAGSQREVAAVFAIAFYAQFATTARLAIWMFAQICVAIVVPLLWPAAAPVLLLALLFAAAGLLVAEWRGWAKAPAWSLFCYSLSYFWWRGQNGAQHPEEVSGLLTGAFLLFAAWTFYRAITKTRPLHPAELFVIAANGAAYFAASYPLLNPQYHVWLGAFTVLVGGIHLALAKLLWGDERPGLLALGVALAYLTLAIPIQFAGFQITIAWSLEAAALAWLAARFHQDRLRFAAWIIFVLVGIHLLRVDAYLYFDPKQYSAILNARFLAFAVAAVSLWLAAKFAGAGIEAAAPYIAGHIVLLWGLAMEMTGWVERSMTTGDVWSTESTGFSILLALYALALIALGVATRTSINRILGLALLAIVVAKLYLSDVWELGMGFRISAFLALGVLLLLVSYLYSRFRPLIERLWRDDR